MQSIKIENVVASTDINAIISLDKLAATLDDSEYEPGQFPGLMYRLAEPRAAVLIFQSGRIVCVGARNTTLAKEALKKAVADVKKAGVAVDESAMAVHIEGIVAAADLMKELNLEKLVALLENSEYEPERFPGLVYRLDEPSAAFLIFSSGRIVCTGVKSADDASIAFTKLKKKIVA